MRIRRIALFVGLILMVFAFVLGYRVRAADEALEYAPSSVIPVVLLPGTTIEAVMNNAIEETAEPGDSVSATVSKPVVFDNRVVIPPGAKLRGTLEKFIKIGDKAKATVEFASLVIDGRGVAIQSQRVLIVTPLRSDLEILGSAFKALVGASLGGSLGAKTNDPLLIRRGMVDGVGSSVFDTSSVHFTLTLTGDVAI